MQADIGYTCNPLQVLLNINNTKVFKIPCILNGSAEFREQSPVDCQRFI